MPGKIHVCYDLLCVEWDIVISLLVNLCLSQLVPKANLTLALILNLARHLTLTLVLILT